MNEYKEASKQLLNSMMYAITEALKNTTKIYDGIILSGPIGDRWRVQFNGEVHELKAYGTIVPTSGKMVKVYIPQGNMSVAYFE